MPSAIVTRFAPSPTGRLHVGNLRTALHNWLWARQAGGRFLLRLDDTDRARSTPEHADAITRDLAWFGLDVDGRVRQSDRFALYEREFARLATAGRVYRAYETPEELELRRKVLAGRGLPPIYERTALALSDADHDRLAADGRRPHWRFRLDERRPIEWNDLVRGPQRIDPATQSDPVVRRADGSWLYLLPSVIDDIDMGVTHVVRGEDHVTNTALQLQMFDALGAGAPAFAHEALLVGSEGKLSKRLGSLGVDAFQADGIEPVALAALLARLGTSDPVEPVADLSALAAAGLDFARFGRAPARFDGEELAALNARVVHDLAFDAVKDRLPAGMTDAMWRAVRPNLQTVDGAAAWMPVLAGEIACPALSPDDRAFADEAGGIAAGLAWDDPWGALTAALKARTGRKGRALFLPLRQALTGLDHGPDMAALLPLIGQARTVARLHAAAAG